MGISKAASSTVSLGDDKSRRALLIAHPAHLAASSGGVQKCTAEFIDTLRHAGFALQLHSIQSDCRLTTRIARQLVTNPYAWTIAQADYFRIRALASEVEVVFVNQAFLAGAVVKALEGVVPRPPVVILSHGSEITDFLHFVRLRRTMPLSGKARPTAAFALGATLLAEMKSRKGIDAVVAISDGDAEIERWFGAPTVTVLPRTISPKALDWRPVVGRFGYVGTLDHAPNLEGVVLLLEAMNTRGDNGQIRIVGGPSRLGAWLAMRFSNVNYLGQLDDDALRKEASTWQAFVHPIFCSPRGASTKLAQPIEWGIPIVTTVAGHRGYRWSEGELIVVDGPGAFAAALSAPEAEFHVARESVLAIARTSPNITEVAEQLKRFLAPLLTESVSYKKTSTA